MRLADRVARSVIRIGGVATIGAISTVFLFLLWVVWPLLRGESISAPLELSSGLAAGERVLAAGADDQFSTMWAWTDAARFVTIATADGSTLEEIHPFAVPPVSFAFPVRAGEGVFGFADGSVRFARVENRTEYRDADQMPEALRDRKAGDHFLLEGKVGERVNADQFALRSIGYTVDDPIPLVENAAIHAVDLSVTSNGPAFASIDTNGVLRVTQVSTTQNFMTGKDELSTESGEIRLEVAARGLPKWVLLRGLGDNALAVWEDGHAVRVDVRDLAKPAIVEELDLLRDPQAQISSATFLTGKNTIVVGDTRGGLHAWFKVPAPTMATGDGAHFIRAHDLQAGPAAVTALIPSPRTRLLAAGYADGTVRIYHVTSERLVAESHARNAISALAMLPDDKTVVAWDGRFEAFELDAPHPEVSAGSLFRPVLYEGYPKPDHVWQSSSGSDDFEPKLGLWPLVFGTMKATFYSMLFGVPIALMAAIYTSEFLRPEVKAVVKPSIEMMASLPSVVLGFLAALVLAPLVERSVTEVLAAVVLVPFSLLLAAHLWQFAGSGRRAKLEEARFALAGVAILAGVAAAVIVGPALERHLFAGDIHRWLDGRIGDATAGWLFVTLPLTATSAAVVVGRIGRRTERGSAAVRSLAVFLAASVAAIAAAWGAASLLSAAGLDLRGTFLGTYVQRNALVVGFVMAFAIIPIIYTIAEDALSSIPESLRAGSLALGATPWQTAVRIVIPTAMSGLFSAMMIGLGRAVGETMIVLMAAGNTPVLEWNVFNGFRTLSANIAVELPEAVRGGSHYRTLFLAAFTLFIMTFVLNTAAELVRLRFRSRAASL
ncbi:MAG TPA: ABC transporter permease subunit [Candidatus Limnocylindrales bacterium]|nr:ABC transporter permease subunit [Candidatus Limnocylindrales bacterium]